MKYMLEYDQPYEYDPNDSEGGHEIGWQKRTAKITADTDIGARNSVHEFLEQDSYISNHWSIDNLKVYKRRFISLKYIREVDYVSYSG